MLLSRSVNLARPSLLPLLSRPFGITADNARVEEVRAAAADRLQGRVKFFKAVGIKTLGESASLPSAFSPISAGVDLSAAGTKAKTTTLTPERLASLTPRSVPTPAFHTVVLDGRALKTPAKNELALPTPALAHLIAHEWDYQASHIEPSSMPMMILASTVLDQTSADKDFVRKNCMNYLFNDTICYHAGSDDRVLRRKQKGLWEPLLEFVGSDSVLGEGVAVLDGDFVLGSLKHSDEVVRRAKELVWGYDVWELTALQAVTMEAKSLLVGLCVLEGFLTADAAVAASRVEEEFSVEQWGLVEGGHDMDRLNNDVQIRAAVLLLDTLKMN